MTVRRYTALTGMLSPLVTFTSMALAIYISSDFSWTRDSISSLAGKTGDTPIWSATGIQAWLLNIGLMVGGSLTMVFALGLGGMRAFRRGLISHGRIMLLISGLLLFLVGLFPLTTGLPHYIVAYSLFVVTPFPPLLIGMGMRRKSVPQPFRLFIPLGILAAIPFLVPWPFDGLAIPEVLSSIPIAIFQIILGTGILRGWIPPHSSMKVEEGSAQITEEE